MVLSKSWLSTTTLVYNFVCMEATDKGAEFAFGCNPLLTHEDNKIRIVF
ncbi:hypothetical protein [Dysgonomonas sp. HGC4]|nr:hypothetical protein [Dysgonomonas sp. HGC4]MBD8349950.1 hypothetical protein [Dysgonomonas sp. HGC4]